MICDYSDAVLLSIQKCRNQEMETINPLELFINIMIFPPLCNFKREKIRLACDPPFVLESY